jgi:hypothetical protein
MKYIIKVDERNTLKYEIEADSLSEAIELLRSGEIDKPEPVFSEYDYTLEGKE